MSQSQTLYTITMPKRKLLPKDCGKSYQKSQSLLQDKLLSVPTASLLSSKEASGERSVDQDEINGNGSTTSRFIRSPRKLKSVSSSSSSESSPTRELRHRRKHKKRKVTTTDGDEADADSDGAIIQDKQGRSENTELQYWKDLAEERRVALEEALTENQKLTEKLEILEAENRDLEEMLSEAKTLAEMINTISEADVDDSGIGTSLSTTLSTSTESVE